MNLENEKELKSKINQARSVLNIRLQNGFITESDIIHLLYENQNFSLMMAKNSHKLNTLKEIFNSPFILCDQENLSMNIKKLLPLLLQCRYEMEIKELNNFLESGFISKEEYENQENLLKYCYYESSQDGKNILKTGHAIGVLNNTSKVR